MKNALRILAVSVMVLMLVSGCGKSQTPPEKPADVSDIKTMGDAFQYEQIGYGIGEEKAVYVFKVGDDTYRAVADMTEEMAKEYFALDIMDDDHDVKLKELLGPVEIKELVNVTEATPTEEELNALVGKTGQELLDDGWTCSGYYLDGPVFLMDHGWFEYEVSFNEEIDTTNYDPDTFDEVETIRPLTVKSVTCTGIGQGVID